MDRVRISGQSERKEACSWFDQLSRSLLYFNSDTSLYTVNKTCSVKPTFLSLRLQGNYVKGFFYPMIVDTMQLLHKMPTMCLETHTSGTNVLKSSVDPRRPGPR